MLSIAPDNRDDQPAAEGMQRPECTAKAVPGSGETGRRALLVRAQAIGLFSAGALCPIVRRAEDHITSNSNTGDDREMFSAIPSLLYSEIGSAQLAGLTYLANMKRAV
jgi:hypothetical protein